MPTIRLSKVIIGIYAFLGVTAIFISQDASAAKNSFISSNLFSIFLPDNWLVFIVTFFVMLNAVFVEYSVGLAKTFLITFLSLSLDFASRYILKEAFAVKKFTPAPMSLVMAFLLFYCVLFPTRMNALGVNEKLFCLMTLLILPIAVSLYLYVSIFCGFITFFFLSPFIVPQEVNRS